MTSFYKIISINTKNNTFKYYDDKLKKKVTKKLQIGDHFRYDYLNSGFEDMIEEKTNKLFSKAIKVILPEIKLPNHHSVYIGNGNILEYIKMLNFDDAMKTPLDFIKSRKDLKVATDSLVSFVKKEKKLIENGRLYIGRYENINKRKILIRSDELLKNKKKYKFLSNNCEHAAIYCITGKKIWLKNELTNTLSTMFNLSLKTIETVKKLRNKDNELKSIMEYPKYKEIDF